MAASHQSVQTQPFILPITNLNLAPSEALHQIMDNLNHLSVIVNEAVTAIHSRIQQESELLTSISHRVQKAHKQTSHIAFIPTKSTTVYSLSTYPEVKSHSVDRCPLINTTTAHPSPIKPQRSNYNLSLKQRNEPPTHMDTVRLLHSIKSKTRPTPPKADKLQNTNIPSWVSSVSDCLVFDTNCSAYKPFNNCNGDKDDKRRRYQKRNRRKDTTPDHCDSMSTAPPSVADRYYNAKVQRNSYGERIKYRCVLDRPNMPKFKADWNVFDDAKGMNAVEDMKWHNDNTMEEGFIPSDILNDTCIDIPFEYGEVVDPPNCSRQPTAVMDTNVKQTDINVVCDSKPNNAPVVNTESERVYDEEKEEPKQEELMQPFTIEDDAHNKSLQLQTQDTESGLSSKSEDDDKEMRRVVIDDNALENAKAKLKPTQRGEKKISSGVVSIFDEMEKRRQYYTDTDDESESNSFE